MSWIPLAICSALLLGCYDVAKKAAVRDNAVPAVLFFSVLVGAAIWTPLVLWRWWAPAAAPSGLNQVVALSPAAHACLAGKSALVGASWTLAYFALKHLPLSLASPIRATSPLWTIAIATVFLGERPSGGQWLGIGLILAAFYAFSLVGRREGFAFHRNRWVLCMVAATLLGSCSALYDKYLLQTLRLDAASVQAWFSIYLVPVMLPNFLVWLIRDRRAAPFHWRWVIPLIAITLLLADFLYFTAVHQPAALISVISPLRRTSVLISFAFGIALLKEGNVRPKAICLGVLLLGVFLLSAFRPV